VDVAQRIVVADDEGDIRRLIAFTLRRRGYVVIEAGAGDEALTLIQQEQPDLAVLDVLMPGLTGIEVAEALGQDARTLAIPVILLSALGQVADIQAGLQSGARVYLTKPFAPPDLVASVANVLAGRSPGAS
jgi:two-component system, OmpR family, response regulator MtrA